MAHNDAQIGKKNDNDKLEGKLGTCQHKHTHTPNNETKRENE